MLDSTLIYHIGVPFPQTYMKEGFMFIKLMDLVSIVAAKGTNLLVAD